MIRHIVLKLAVLTKGTVDNMAKSKLTVEPYWLLLSGQNHSYIKYYVEPGN